MSDPDIGPPVDTKAGVSKIERPKKPRAPKPQFVEEKFAGKIGTQLAEELAGIIRHGVLAIDFERLAFSPRPSSDNSTTPTLCSDNSTTLSTSVTIASMASSLLSSSSSSTGSGLSENRQMKSRYKNIGKVYTLEDLYTRDAINTMRTFPMPCTSKAIASLYAHTVASNFIWMSQYAQVSHMVMLDRSYSFFITEKRDAALCFKVKDHVAVIGGDPLCQEASVGDLLREFEIYRKKLGWGIAFLGATSKFAQYAQKRKWVTLKFGVERVLNPMTNPVLLENNGGSGGKRAIAQSKQLIRNGIALGVYSPKHRPDPVLQAQFVDIYDKWCASRNKTRDMQAYLTIYDPFSISELMTYIYTKDASGKPNGFAALRKIVNGYHLDPCIAAPGAARGISELLIIASMSLLREMGISLLSLGFEPVKELGAISGMTKPFERLTRDVHNRIYRDLPLGGKRDFHDKFRPDDTQEADLYIVFPTRVPQIRHMKATMHVVNIDISKIVAAECKKMKADLKSAIRNKAEASKEALKMRWRVLLKTREFKVEAVPKVTISEKAKAVTMKATPIGIVT